MNGGGVGGGQGEFSWNITGLDADDINKNGLVVDFLSRLVTRELSSAATNDDDGKILVFFFSVLIVSRGGEGKIPFPLDDVFITCRLDCNRLRHLLFLQCRNHRHDKGSIFY